MKIRNGFVSNSSSSSFIIGLSKVADEKKLKNILKKVPESEKYSYKLGTFDEILKSSLVSKIYDNNNVLRKILVFAPVNSGESISIDVDLLSCCEKDTIIKQVKNKKGNIVLKKSKALWFVICLGNDEGDGLDSPFYRYTKFQNFLYYMIVNPLNTLSKKLLYPIIKLLNKVFNKNWFYPYISIYPKSGYDKVKNYKFFKEEWQREIVKAFEDRYKCYYNSGIFSDDYGTVYKIGADRNG